MYGRYLISFGLAVLAAMPGPSFAGDASGLVLPSEVLDRIGLQITQQTIGLARAPSDGKPEIFAIGRASQAAPSGFRQSSAGSKARSGQRAAGAASFWANL